MNKVILKGNLVADPETRKVGQDQKTVCRFRLAVSEYKSTVFVDVDCWQKTAENCSKYLSKGSSVLVEGRLAETSWEKEGKKHFKHFIVGERVDFLDKPDTSGAEKSDTAETPSNKAASSDDDDVPF